MVRRQNLDCRFLVTSFIPVKSQDIQYKQPDVATLVYTVGGIRLLEPSEKLNLQFERCIAQSRSFQADFEVFIFTVNFLVRVLQYPCCRFSYLQDR